MTVDEALDVLEGSASGIGAAEAVETMRRYVEQVRKIERQAAWVNLTNTARALAAAREGRDDD